MFVVLFFEDHTFKCFESVEAVKTCVAGLEEGMYQILNGYPEDVVFNTAEELEEFVGPSNDGVDALQQMNSVFAQLFNAGRS